MLSLIFARAAAHIEQAVNLTVDELLRKLRSPLSVVITAHIPHPQLSQGWLGLMEVDNCC